MPESYDATKFVLVGDLKASNQKAKAAIDAVKLIADGAIRSGNVSGNTVSLYTSTDHSGTAAFSFDFPSELVLDQLQTSFVSNFAFSTATYPNATNPNLDGQSVLVIAVKETAANGTVTTTYSFLSMNALAVKISEAANNAIEVKADGLHVDISGKADKVENATAGNVATLDANGNLTDSGHGIATTAEVTAMLNEVWGTGE